MKQEREPPTEKTEPPKKRMRFTDSFVTLKVGSGSDMETFSAHGTVLKENSKFFLAAFDRNWKEAQSREIELPDDEPEIVNMFLEWLYNGETLTTFVMAVPYPSPGETYMKLCKLYVFGEKIQMNHLCNHVIAAILKFGNRQDKAGIRWHPRQEQVDVIYEGTPSNSPARRLMVYLYVNFGKHNWLRDCSEHPDFLRDLAVYFMKIHKQAVALDIYPSREA